MKKPKERAFKHLTRNDRLRIEKWLRKGWRPKQIADKLRVHPSTIYRELKRGAYERLNGDTWEMETAYSPDIAEEKYQAQLREKGPDLKIGKDHELAEYIERTILERDCSPAAVLGYAMMEGKKFKTTVSVQTIYKYIKMGLFLHITQVDLPRRGKHKHSYKKVNNKFRDQCGAELTPGAAFCDECGAPQVSPDTCPKCGFKFIKPGKFCPKCGAKREADGENDPAIKTALMQLAEKIRFSDPISNETLTDLENGILARILLKSTTSKLEIVREINSLLGERNKRCKILK